MMNGHDVNDAGGVAHFDDLLGIGVRTDPRFVSADGHDREIVWAIVA